ncbi:MAG: S1 RNA-binding domain-containing protein [Nanoarchaeota archaeon]
MNFKEDDLILGTVKKIEGTTAYVELDNETQGSLSFSEIAPGRIRNIREFISLGKKIVCKVLRVRDSHVELTLRRVTSKERQLVLDSHKKEKVLTIMLKSVLKDRTQDVLAKISEQYDPAAFIETARTDTSLLTKFVSKSEAETLQTLFAEKEEREKSVKKTVILKSLSPSGLYDIQQALNTTQAEIHYLGSSVFSVVVKDTDFKRANTKMSQILKEIEDRVKKHTLKLEIK